MPTLPLPECRDATESYYVKHEVSRSRPNLNPLANDDVSDVDVGELKPDEFVEFFEPSRDSWKM